MVHKKGSQSGQGFGKITKTEQEVLLMLTEDFLTPNKIAIRRGTSVRAVYKHIENLKEKGLINKSYKMVHKSGFGCEPFLSEGSGRYRLHALELSVKPLHLSEFFRKQRGKRLVVDGNTVVVYESKVEVYVGRSFWGESVQRATSLADRYISRLLVRLENDLKTILVKDRANNVSIVNAHYSDVRNGLARECNVSKDKIKVYASDGKLWFLIDNSFNLNEAETVHRQSSRRDMEEVVAPFFNDLRMNEACTLSDIKRVIALLVRENRETAAGLNSVVQLLKPKEEEVVVNKDKSLFDYVG